jgi:outer membrane protein assembly factor BamD (BamD/ComL family)
MKSDSRSIYNIIVWFTTVVLMMSIFTGITAAQAGRSDKESDKDLMEKAKLELFDRKWVDALKTLDHVIDQFPGSPHSSLAFFYKGKCLKEMGKTREALTAYNRYLEVSENKSLREEAYIAIIDLDYQLYDLGSKGFIEQVIELLDNREPNVRYYAAFKLSYTKDKSIARKAAPVLKKVVKSEDDDELVDRAKLALMRIDPNYLKDVSESKSIEKRMFNLRVIDKKTNNVSFSLSIPFVLAKLAMDSLPEEGKDALEEKNLNIEKILDTLAKAPRLMRFEEKDVIVELWLE